MRLLSHTRTDGRPRAAVVVLPAILLLTTGCSLDRFHRLPAEPANPFPGIGRVVVMPLAAPVPEGLDMHETARWLAAELISFPGFEVILPDEARVAIADLGRGLDDPEDYATIGRALDADAVLVVQVHAWDVYAKRMVLSAVLLETDLARDSPPIWDLLGAGQPWMAAEGRETNGLVIGIQRDYDSQERHTQRRLKGWANLHRIPADAGWERHLLTTERYARFCSNLLLRDLCEAGRRRFHPARPR